MDRIYQLIRDADFICFAFTAWLVFFIGIRASAAFRKVERVAIWCAAGTLLAYVAAAIDIDGYDPLESIGAYVLRGGLAAVLILGTVCFVGGFVCRTWQFVSPIPRYFRDRRAAEERRIESERQRQQEAIYQRARDEQRRRIEEAAERRAEEYQKRCDEEARLQALAEQRRMQARADCDLCYGRHYTAISYRFGPSMFHAFLQKYMGSDQPADAVESRAKQLQCIIEEHAEAANPPKKSTSIQELTDWFVKQQERISSLPIDDDVRDFHTVQLNIRYSELTQAILEKVEP
jgi:hypothetical protein